MPIEPVYILGAGGHAKVVIDTLEFIYGEGLHIRIFDDDPSRANSTICGRLIETAHPLKAGDLFHITIGGNAARSSRFRQIEGGGSKPLSVVHPTSAVAATATLGDGVFIAAMAVVGPDSMIGTGTIVNHTAVVDHDCLIGQFSHIAPRSVLGGGVTIGERVLVGAGAVVMPGLTLASHVVIGAGAVVTRSITRAGTFVGIPARELVGR